MKMVRLVGVNYLGHYFGFCKDICSNCGREFKQVIKEEFICRGSTKFQIINRLTGGEI